jgi:hypothetical protein
VTANLVFEDISIQGDSTTKPKTGWFFARNTAGSDGGGHRLRNCRTSGYFTVAPIYAFGSELNEYTECWIWNQNDDTPALIITALNVRAQTSSFITVASTGQSNDRAQHHWWVVVVRQACECIGYGGRCGRDLSRRGRGRKDHEVLDRLG